MRVYAKGLPIRVRLDATGMPTAFTWSGHTHLVARVEEIREPHLDWWSPIGPAHRIYYLISTRRGIICDIYRDLVSGEWFLARVYD
jgi:hypothetical protein